MLKNDTLKNDTPRNGLCGRAPSPRGVTLKIFDGVFHVMDFNDNLL